MEIDKSLYKALCTGRIYVQKDSMGNVVHTNAVDPVFYNGENEDMTFFWLHGRYYRKMTLPFPDIDLYEDVSEQVIDKITGCYKKEALCAYISSHQDAPPFLLAVCDIDNFKYVNDTFGHHYGDDVIERIGSIFRSMVGESGLACRWGGDEFVLIVPEAEQNKLEQIRMAVASEVLPFGYSVTITIGATRYEPGENVEEAIKRADISLYNGKDQGRNIAVMDYARRNKVLCMGKRIIPRTKPSSKAQNE